MTMRMSQVIVAKAFTVLPAEADKRQVIATLVQSLATTKKFPADKLNEIVEGAMAREAIGSTGIGHGIAIPHGRIKGLKETACAFVRMKVPIDFDAPDSLPVDLLFILLAPAAASDLHLQILAELAQMFSDKAMRDKLRAAPDAASLHDLIREWTP